MSDLVLRHPSVDDGLAAWRLVRDSGVLDLNSVYAYCATFRHFPTTCVVAMAPDGLAGMVTGHRIPGRPDTLFVWQVGVQPAHRGKGLAGRMLHWLVRDAASGTPAFIETTVTPENAPSRALFRSFARKLETPCEVGPGLTPHHLGDDHAPEDLFRIGPLPGSTP